VEIEGGRRRVEEKARGRYASLVSMILRFQSTFSFSAIRSFLKIEQ
jgi:hypothetical protein